LKTKDFLTQKFNALEFSYSLKFRLSRRSPTVPFRMHLEPLAGRGRTGGGG